MCRGFCTKVDGFTKTSARKTSSSSLQRVETTAEFERRYDFFSAGIVLFEIGLWCTMSDLFDRKFNIPPTKRSAEQNRSALRKTHVPQLRHRIGKSYQDAVAFCLESLK